jgi:predicted nucleotidyltransferase
MLGHSRKNSMLNPDFREMLSCLKDEGVEFIIVGAYALAAHGLPRATGDIDIWVRNSPGNARKVIRALVKFGAPVSNLSETDFTSPETIVQIGVEPSRIDLLTGIDGVEFGDAWDNKINTTVDDLELYVLSKADLLKNKSATGREKDQADITWLKKN